MWMDVPVLIFRRLKMFFDMFYDKLDCILLLGVMLLIAVVGVNAERIVRTQRVDMQRKLYKELLSEDLWQIVLVIKEDFSAKTDEDRLLTFDGSFAIRPNKLCNVFEAGELERRITLLLVLLDSVYRLWEKHRLNIKETALFTDVMMSVAQHPAVQDYLDWLVQKRTEYKIKMPFEYFAMYMIDKNCASKVLRELFKAGNSNRKK